jgi:predicted dehydrogenase
VTARPQVRIGILGYGIMGKAHTYAYRVAPMMRGLSCEPRVQVISGRNAQAVERAAQAYDIPEWCTDWRAVLSRNDIDVVDICTPPGTHAEIVAAAAQAGKAIVCEKPLATSYADGRRAVDAATHAGVLHAIGFNYRRLPAVSLMKQLVEEGAVGRVQLFRTTWLTDEFSDPAVPFDWRFDRKMGGTTICDLGSHLVDLARWIVGDVEATLAESATFVSERANPAGGPPILVTVDDASSALVRFTNGARGTFEMARNCVRHPCDLSFEVNGTQGSIAFDYARMNELWYGLKSDDPRLYGLRRIRTEHVSHPYAAQWWPIGQGIGYGSSFVNQIADLLERWPEGPWTPDLSEGLAAQAVCEAMERSVEEQRWVRVDEVTNT